MPGQCCKIIFFVIVVLNLAFSAQFNLRSGFEVGEGYG